MPKERKDYLISLDVLASSAEMEFPSSQIGVMTLIPRIRVAHGAGINCVAFHYGYDFKIQVDRIIAERLRDDLARWLKTYPAPSRKNRRTKGGR
jgi:hypothetical protein